LALDEGGDQIGVIGPLCGCAFEEAAPGGEGWGAVLTLDRSGDSGADERDQRSRAEGLDEVSRDVGHADKSA
jgi:hypothetical protein